MTVRSGLESAAMPGSTALRGPIVMLSVVFTVAAVPAHAEEWISVWAPPAPASAGNGSNNAGAIGSSNWGEPIGATRAVFDFVCKATH